MEPELSSGKAGKTAEDSGSEDKCSVCCKKLSRQEVDTCRRAHIILTCDEESLCLF